MEKVKVIDAICGAGKTSYAIQMMNENTFGKKFIFVTPFLSEVKRVIGATNLNMATPIAARGKGKKLDHLKKLLADGRSIAITHQLFKMMDHEAHELIKESDYTLIMDEVAEVIEVFPIASQDIDILINDGHIKIEKDSSVTWLSDYKQDEKHAIFADVKNDANLGILKAFGNTKLQMVSLLPINSFSNFKEVYILTYLFDGQLQKYYYDYFDLQYKKYSVIKKGDLYKLVSYHNKYDQREKLKELLTIYEDYETQGRPSTLNSNYFARVKKTNRYLLSYSWYESATPEKYKRLQQNLTSFFRTQATTDNDKLFWTTYKSKAKRLSNAKCKFNKYDDREKDNFVPCTIRATNDYAHCTAMAYMVNRFLNPVEKQFFLSHDIHVDEDLLALSELIQFMFRGSIRNGEKMACYIPSERQRDLLKKYLDYLL
ncbi:hypothetical protein [Exiguobacterium sp. s48]|uniref:hypothetical protein n=1 Tax=Exiguobacterium sp. s48 TaxID=2751273 RepID=UPI001BE55E03|nr:hypothetical protein [Exiguobacterium sp. s48]